MAHGWRNRYMAPFYALAISFLLVLLVGVTLDAPATPQRRPEPPAPSIRFSSGQDDFPITSAIVLWGNEMHTVRTDAQLRALKPTDPVLVCARLDEGWEAVRATELGDTKYWCWGPLEPRKPGADITIPVEAAK